MTLTFYFGEYDEKEFDYSIDYETLLDFVCSNIDLEDFINFIEFTLDDDIREEYNIDTQEKIKQAFLNKDNTLDELFLNMDDEIGEYFKDELWDYFEEDIIDKYEDELEYKRNPLGYYGLNQSDFM